MNTIYALTDPLTHEAKYIGMTSQPLETRLKAHCSGYASQKVSEWVWSLYEQGVIPEIVALEVEPVRAKAAQSELFWIRYMKSLGSNLLNAVHLKTPAMKTSSLQLTPALVDDINQAAFDRNVSVGHLLLAALRALELQEAHRDKELKP